MTFSEIEAKADKLWSEFESAWNSGEEQQYQKGETVINFCDTAAKSVHDSIDTLLKQKDRGKEENERLHKLSELSLKLYNYSNKCYRWMCFPEY